MPATFIASQRSDGSEADPKEDEASKRNYLVKFFENGEYSVEGPWQVELRQDHAQWYNGVCYRDIQAISPSFAVISPHRYIYIYMLAPPQDLLLAPFCLPKVLPESFLAQLKRKTKKNKNKQKKHQ